MKSIFTLLLLVTLSYSNWIDDEQYNNIVSFKKDIATVVKKHPEFKKYSEVVLGMYLRESSLGKVMVSDRIGTLRYIIINGKNVEISRSTYLKEAVKYANSDNYYVIRNGYKKKIRTRENYVRPITKASLGSLNVRLDTAELVIKHYELKEHYWLLADDLMMVNKLLNDNQFNLLLSFYYLEYNYKRAISLKLSSPMKRAIGKHNGGWSNFKYYAKVKADAIYVASAYKARKNHYARY